MALINIGSSENDPTAESIRSAFNKLNIAATQGATYTVSKIGSNYTARDGDGVVVGTPGTDAGPVIQAALDENSSRTSYQTVRIVDDANIGTAILVPSWSRVVVDATLTATADINILQAGTTPQNIIIEGFGVLDADATGKPIVMSSVTDLVIRDVTAIDPKTGGHCINVSGCTRFAVRNTTCKNPGDDGISVTNSTNGEVSGNDISGTGGSASSGIEIEDSAGKIAVFGNRVHDFTPTGNTSAIHIILDDGSTYMPVSQVAITDNVIDNVTCAGIGFRSNDVNRVGAGGVISGNVISRCYRNSTTDPSGINIGPSNAVTVTGNAIFDVSVAGITTTGTGTSIVGNSITLTGEQGIFASGNRPVVMGNTLRDTDNKAISFDGGVDLICSGNVLEEEANVAGKIWVRDYASIGAGTVITLTGNFAESPFTLTEGTDWDAATSNTATAQSINDAITAANLTGITNRLWESAETICLYVDRDENSGSAITITSCADDHGNSAHLSCGNIAMEGVRIFAGTTGHMVVRDTIAANISTSVTDSTTNAILRANEGVADAN